MKARRILCTLLVLFVCVAAMATKANAANVSGDWEYTLSEGNAVISAYNGSATNVTIPDEIDGLSVVGIGNKVFQNNYDLVSVILPGNLRSIGEYAFSGCTSLTSITLPEKLESVGYRAFYNTKKLEKITVNSKEPLIKSALPYRFQIWYNNSIKAMVVHDNETRNLYRYGIQLPQKENQAGGIPGNHGRDYSLG